MPHRIPYGVSCVTTSSRCATTLLSRSTPAPAAVSRSALHAEEGRCVASHREDYRTNDATSRLLAYLLTRTTMSHNRTLRHGASRNLLAAHEPVPQWAWRKRLAISASMGFPSVAQSAWAGNTTCDSINNKTDR